MSENLDKNMKEQIKIPDFDPKKTRDGSLIIGKRKFGKAVFLKDHPELYTASTDNKKNNK